MPSDLPTASPLIIPFGIARVTEASQRRAPRVEIDTAVRAPLRLGDGPYSRRMIAEEASAAPSGDAVNNDDGGVGAARLDTLRRLHLRNCDVFDKYLRRWIDLYFDFVAAQALDCTAELAALSRTPDAALDPLLWGMAALRPLPRAHIPVADGAFVPVDVAMWDGDELVAIVFAGGEKARLARNLAVRARLVTVEPPAEGAEPDLIRAQLGDVVAGYWRGLAVPPGPFGPAPFRLRTPHGKLEFRATGGRTVVLTARPRGSRRIGWF